MSYVDGFEGAVPTANKDAYTQLASTSADVPFDGKRMIWGGFEVLVER